MALSDENQHKVRYYLGLTDRYRDQMHSLNSAFALLSTYAQTTVEAIIANLESIDTKLGNAHDNLDAEQVGTIALNGRRQIYTLRSEGRREVNRLASILGVECVQDVFGGGVTGGYLRHG